MRVARAFWCSVPLDTLTAKRWNERRSIVPRGSASDYINTRLNESSDHKRSVNATGRGGRDATGLPDASAPQARELSAIYEHAPGILFYIAVEPDGQFRFLSMSDAG